MPNTIDLSTLGSDGVAFSGPEFATAGFSVASAGDINGDGFDDFIVGAPDQSYYGFYYSQGRTFAYLVFGRPDGFANSNLATLGPPPGFVIEGLPRSGFGFSVASAGDINGDGYDDIIVGAPFNGGHAYVIFGKASGFANFNLSNLAPADGFFIEGDAQFDAAGFNVGSAGDINGDGYDDIVIGAPFGDDGGEDAGEAYVIFGKANGFGNIGLSNLSSTTGFVIRGDSAHDNAGFSLGGTADINGDGYDDLIVSAPFGDNGGDSAGEVYVIFGKASGLADIDLTNLTMPAGFVIQGDAAGDMAGRSVAAGDVNGDGYDDIIIGAPGGDNGGPESGSVHVVFGKAGGFANIDLSSLSAADGFTINGDSDGDRAGFSVAAGDVNGDGYDDVILGAPYGNDGGENAGEAYVVFGKAGGFTNIDLTGLAPADGFIVQGDDAFDNAGYSVAAADLNADGFADVLLGAPFDETSAFDGGSAYVVFGRASAGETINGGPGDDVIQGSAGPDVLGGLGGNDTLSGAAGNDALYGGTGSDVMSGGGGNDSFLVDSAGDTVIEAAGEGWDAVYSDVDYVLAAGTEVEGLGTWDPSGTAAINLTGNGIANYIVGNAGSNALDGGGGADTLEGRGGNDYYVVDNAGDRTVELAGGGWDAVYAAISYTLTAGSEIEGLATLNPGGTAALGLTGNEIANYIVGNAGNNLLDGRGGNDILEGLGGNDDYVVDSAADAVIELAGGGADTVYASVSYALAAGSEIEGLTTLNASGTAAISLTGNEIANYIVGNAGSNAIDGRGGSDVLEGRGGNDYYVVDNLWDAVIELVGGGWDAVYTSVSYTLGAGSDIEGLATLNPGATTAIDLTGNAIANYIVGNAGANVLDGKGGADTLEGGNGADTYQFTTSLGGGNVDAIISFSVADDTIALDDAVFTGRPLGTLAAGAFVIGTAAGDADDRIIYNSTTGQLFFDADGNGAGAAVLFATVSSGLAMTNADFVVI